jgi:hypothetical protein
LYERHPNRLPRHAAAQERRERRAGTPMSLKLSPKQARKMGLVEKETRQPAPRRQAGPNSYAGCGLLGWQFATEGAQGECVYAWKVQKGVTLRTSVYPAGAGDDLGKHYRPAIEAIGRGEWTEDLPS